MTNQPPYAAHFFHPCTIGLKQQFRYAAGDIAIIPSIMAKEVIEKDLGEVFSADDLFTRFTIGTRLLPFVHLSGGIGDIIAFSALSMYLKDYIIVAYASEHFNPIIAQFASGNICTRPYMAKIMNGTGSVEKLCRIPIEFVAIQAGAKNWFEAYFERIGVTPGEEYYHPEMVTKVTPEKGTIMICHRASCQMRSSNFEDFYVPAKRVLGNKRYFVSEMDLTDRDKLFINSHALDVTILKSGTIADHLDSLASMELVISTDTGALHYREAIRRPAIGVYAAFTVNSRTKYYRYTSSWNIASECPYQPCFAHELAKGAICKLAETTGDELTAPCQTGELFQGQLEGILKGYKY